MKTFPGKRFKPNGEKHVKQTIVEHNRLLYNKIYFQSKKYKYNKGLKISAFLAVLGYENRKSFAVV